METPLISDQLLNLTKQTLQTAENFYVLGELEAIDAFRTSLMDSLSKQGWPVADAATRYKNGTDGLFESMLINSWMIKPSDKDWKRNISYWVEQMPPDVQALFLTQPKLQQLEDALNAATRETKDKYGDPGEVKHGQRRTSRSIFNALAAKFTKEETTETKLYKALKEVSVTIGDYSRTKGIPSLEFQGRMEEQLAKQAWPVTPAEDVRHSLRDTFWRLAQAAGEKTSLFVRLNLQDDTSPPHKPAREAKDFILSHIDSIPAATKAVAAELDKEKASPKGVTFRYCRPA